ncbi:MAG: hypothetical protein ACM3XM_08300 [Mycobacterium leprae]
MYSIRCRCGKIVCQVANVPEMPKVEETPQTTQGPAAAILCRHCKTYVILRFPAVSAVQYTHSVDQLEATPVGSRS